MSEGFRNRTRRQRNYHQKVALDGEEMAILMSDPEF